MSHHSTGPGSSFQVANKLLLRTELAKSYQQHMQNLKGIHHVLDDSEPRKHNHLRSRLRQMQQETDRQAVIDMENKRLRKKMNYIVKHGGPVDTSNHFQSKSLNMPFRERFKERVIQENASMTHRIHSVKPMIHNSKWEHEYQHTQYLKKLWNESVKDYKQFVHVEQLHRKLLEKSSDVCLDAATGPAQLQTSEKSDPKQLPQLENFTMTRNTQAMCKSFNTDDSRKRKLTKLPSIVQHKGNISHVQ